MELRTKDNIYRSHWSVQPGQQMTDPELWTRGAALSPRPALTCKTVASSAWRVMKRGTLLRELCWRNTTLDAGLNDSLAGEYMAWRAWDVAGASGV